MFKSTIHDILISILESFSHQLEKVVSYWSLSYSKSPPLSRTQSRILTNFRITVVWMVIFFWSTIRTVYFPGSWGLFQELLSWGPFQGLLSWDCSKNAYLGNRSKNCYHKDCPNDSYFEDSSKNSYLGDRSKNYYLRDCPKDFYFEGCSKNCYLGDRSKNCYLRDLA